MKKLAGVFIILYIIFTISGIICDHDSSCKSINERCSKDSDCCYEKCSFSFLYFKRYCNDNTNKFSSMTSYFFSKEQKGNCSYNKPTDDEVSDKIDKHFGLNAAHAILPSGTKVEVTLNGKKLIVTVNGRPTNENGAVLEFSKETAMALNIGNGESVPCKIVIPILENSWYFKNLIYILPCFSLFLIFQFI